MHFFERLQKLRESRPHPCILTVRSENSDYCPYHAAGKNCYRIVGHVGSEDCYYGFWLGVSRDCVDCAFTEKSDLCYECVDIQSCYNCNFCRDTIACSDCRWSYDCKGCQNCFGCVSRNHAEYEILNEKYSKDEYFKRVRQIKDELKKDGTYGKWWWPSQYEEIKPFSSYMA